MFIMLVWSSWAHSGSLLGLLLNPALSDVNDIYKFVSLRMPAKVKAFVTTLVDGGPRYDVPFYKGTILEKGDTNNRFEWTQFCT